MGTPLLADFARSGDFHWPGSNDKTSRYAALAFFGKGRYDAGGASMTKLPMYPFRSLGLAPPSRTILLLSLVLIALTPACTSAPNPALQNASSSTLAQFPIHHDTKYFEFHLRRDSPVNEQTMRVSDAFVDIVKHEFFNAERGYPIRVFISEDERGFVQFMNRDLGIPDASDYGIYVFSKKVLATYEQYGLGTFTHETLHPLLEANLPRM